MKSTVKNKKTKEFNQFCKYIVKLSEEVEEELLNEVKGGVERSPTLQNRIQTLKKQSSKRNIQPAAAAENRPAIRRVRPQSAQNHTIYTKLRKQRRLQA